VDYESGIFSFSLDITYILIASRSHSVGGGKLAEQWGGLSKRLSSPPLYCPMSTPCSECTVQQVPLAVSQLAVS